MYLRIHFATRRWWSQSRNDVNKFSIGDDRFCKTQILTFESSEISRIRLNYQLNDVFMFKFQPSIVLGRSFTSYADAPGNPS